MGNTDIKTNDFNETLYDHKESITQAPKKTSVFYKKNHNWKKTQKSVQ